MGMIKFANAKIKDRNPFDDASAFKIRTAKSVNLKRIRPGCRYYVVGGLHGDKPNGNGDRFSWDEELLRQLNGRPVYAMEEIDPEFGIPNFMYETWRGRGNYINHNSLPRTWANKQRVGTVIDTYPDFQEKCIDFLVEVEEARAPWLVKGIDNGSITDTSMGTYVDYSICSCCGNIAEDVEHWCDHLKQRKGKKCLEPNCTGRCHEYGMVFEDNKDCTGLEDSWIVAGHGADSDAKHKYTIAELEEDTMALKGISRANVPGEVTGGTGIDQGLLSQEIRAVKAARNGGMVNDKGEEISAEMIKMAEALGPEKLKALGIDPSIIKQKSAEETSLEDMDLEAANLADAEDLADASLKRASELSDKAVKKTLGIEDELVAAERQAALEKEKPAILAEAKEARIKAIDAELGTVAQQKERVANNVGVDTEAGKKILARINTIENELITERRALSANNEGDKMLDDKQIAEVVRQTLAQAGVVVPSASAESGTGGEGYKVPDDPSTMVSPEQLGREHSVTPALTNDELGQVKPGDITVPNPAMKNGTGDESYNVATDPASMVGPEQFGRDHSVTMPGITQAVLQKAVAAGIQQFAQLVGMPTESDKELGDQAYNVNTNPESMVSPEKPGHPHTVSIPESSKESTATDAAIPTSATKADEDGDQAYKVPDDPDSMVSPEQLGRDHAVKPAVEAKKKRPGCTKCNAPLVFGKCPKCDKKKKEALKAEFVPLSDYKKSHWVVFDNALPMLKVAAGAAFPADTVDHYEFFSSAKYGELLIDEIIKEGHVKTAQAIGGDAFKGPGTSEGDDMDKTPATEGKPPSMGNDTPITPSDDVKDKIMGDDDSGVSPEDVLVGVLSVIVDEGQASADDIRGLLEGFSDPSQLTKFMGRLEQEINDLKDSEKDVSSALGEGDDDDSDTGSKKPPFLGKGGDQPSGSGDQKPPTLAQLKEPPTEDEKAYYAQMFPPDFVKGMFFGEGKTVRAALNKMIELKKDNDALKLERSKTIQAKRVDEVLDRLIDKGMLRDAAQIMDDDNLDYESAKRRASAEYTEKRIELLDMNDDAFEQFVKSINSIKSAKQAGGLPKARGLRSLPEVKSHDVENVRSAALGGDEESELFSMPPDVTEDGSGLASTRSQERKIRKAKLEEAQLDSVENTSLDITSMFTNPPNMDDEDTDDAI